MQVYGLDALLRIVCHFAMIFLTFWALGSLRLDQFFKHLHTPQIRVILILISIVIGYTASSFFLEIIILSRNLFFTTF